MGPRRGPFLHPEIFMKRIFFTTVAIVLAMVLHSQSAWAPCNPTAKLFSDADGESAAVKFAKDSSTLNVCLIGKIINDNDFNDYYINEGDFTVKVISAGSDLIAEKPLKCLAENKAINQWFACAFEIGSDEIPSSNLIQSRLKIVAETYEPSACSILEYIDMPEPLRDRYQYFTEAKMDKLFAAGIDHRMMSLEEGIDDYVKVFLMPGFKHY